MAEFYSSARPVGLRPAGRFLSLFGEKEIPFLLVYNKVDLLERLPEASEGELYVSAKEGSGIWELKERLGALADELWLLTENNLQVILQQAESQNCRLLIVDSIQTVFLPELSSAPGSVAQVRQCGNELMKLAKERGWEEIKCIEIAGVQGDSTNEARMAGYKAGIEAAGGTFLDDEVQYANAVADQAVTCMEAIMQNHPEGIAVICANNDDMAMAAARAAAGNEAYKNTVFLGFDGIQSACKSILAGEETMSVCQQAYDMGYKSVDAVIRALQGETLDEFIDAGASVVDPSTAQARLEELQGYLA